MNILTFTILNLGIFVAFVIIWLVYRSRVPLPGPLVRIGRWADQVRSHPAEEKTATFGDLVLFVTLWVIAVTLWVSFTQGSEERYKAELTEVREQLRSAETRAADESKQLQDVRERMQFPIPLSPAPGEQIVGEHVDLHWDARQGNSATEYIIEITRVGSFENIAGHLLPTGKPCMFRATEPETSNSRFPASGPIESGTYVWRVGLGTLVTPASNDAPCPLDDRIREWSGYSEFTIYRTQAERIAETGEVLVGTNFIQNTPFSRADTDGTPTGFDMDLIRAVIPGCLSRRIVWFQNRKEATVRFDPAKCQETAEKLSKGDLLMPGSGDQTLQPRIVVLAPGVDFRDKMQRRNLDAFIGALTRATERETGDIHFSRGYVAYDSRLLINGGAIGGTTLAEFANSSNPTIGAVENSTNHWLAEELAREYPAIMVQPFISFAQLETQFETRSVPAIIVDGVMEHSLGISARGQITDLTHSQAWRRYLLRIGYCRQYFGIKVGSCAEKFGIAVADDVRESRPNSDGTEAEQYPYPRQLLDALDEALSSDPGRQIIDVLYHRWNLEDYNARRCHYPTDACWEPPPKSHRDLD